MYKLLISICLLTWLCGISCLPESPDNTIEVTFCDLLTSQNEAGIGDIINIYFDSLNYTAFDETLEGQQENIQNFETWFKSHDCVDSTKIICVSCVETNPLQSEIYFRVKTSLVTYEKTMDILMSSPLRFNGFH